MKQLEIIKTYFRLSEEERKTRFSSDSLTAFLGKKHFAAGCAHIVVLNDDGTVTAMGDNSRGQCVTDGWTDVIKVAAGDYHTVGLKSDGTVLATGDNSYGQCGVAGWSEVKDIFAERNLTAGVTEEAVLVNNSAAKPDEDPINVQDDDTTPSPESDFGVFYTSSGYWIYQYRGKRKHVVIPVTIGSNPVKGIGSVFKNNDKVLSIIMPHGMKEIESNSFSGCTALEKVLIPGTVEKIGKGTFKNCSKLRQVILADGIKSIGPAAFKNCPSLKELHIPNSVKKISFDAFDPDIKLICENNPYVEEYAKKTR